jgi:hypothetical protein
MSFRVVKTLRTSQTHGQDSVAVMGLSWRTLAETRHALKKVPQTVTDPYLRMGARILWES